MSRIKTALVAIMAIAAMNTSAEIIDYLTVSTANGSQKFAISDVSEIRFQEDGMLLYKNPDQSPLFFESGWEMTFSTDFTTVINTISDVSQNSPTQVYTIDGRMVGLFSRLSDVSIESLAPGTYLIVTNGKTLKIQR